MAKANFQFNPATGTMEMVGGQQPQTQIQTQGQAEPPRPTAEAPADLVQKPKRKPNVSINEGQVIFREISDRDIIQIQDEKTRQTACVISGYALHFAFNLAELKSVEAIEACLEGLKKLFRHKIMEQMAQKINPS